MMMSDQTPSSIDEEETVEGWISVHDFHQRVSPVEKIPSKYGSRSVTIIQPTAGRSRSTLAMSGISLFVRTAVTKHVQIVILSIVRTLD